MITGLPGAGLSLATPYPGRPGLTSSWHGIMAAPSRKAGMRSGQLLGALACGRSGTPADGAFLCSRHVIGHPSHRAAGSGPPTKFKLFDYRLVACRRMVPFGLQLLYYKNVFTMDGGNL